MRASAAFLLGLLLLCSTTSAQTPDVNQKRYDAMLKSAFVSKVPWVRSFSAAKIKAGKKDKLILGYFTRSDKAAAHCTSIESKLLMTDWWAATSRNYIPYLNITSKLKNTPDQGLIYKLGGAAFPYLVVMDPEGVVLWEIGLNDRKSAETGLAHARDLYRLKMKLAKQRTNPKLRASVALLDACGRVQRPQVASMTALEKAAGLKGVDPVSLKVYLKNRDDIAVAAARYDGGKSVLVLVKNGVKPEGACKKKFLYHGIRAAIDERELNQAKQLVDQLEMDAPRIGRHAKWYKGEIKALRKKIWDVSPD